MNEKPAPYKHILSPQQYLTAFKRSLEFHLMLLYPGQVDLSNGERSDLLDLVCEDIRRVYKLNTADHVMYKRIAKDAILTRTTQ